MITTTFTDPQGSLHIDAIFALRSASLHTNSSEVFSLNSTDFTTITNPAPNENKRINLSFYYWISQAAKDAGAAPYILANSSEMDMDFNFQPDASYDGFTLEEKCELYLVNEILPPLQ